MQKSTTYRTHTLGERVKKSQHVAGKREQGGRIELGINSSRNKRQGLQHPLFVLLLCDFHLW